MRRILTTGTLGVLATLAMILFSAGSAAARVAPSGTFTVNPGQTISFTNMNIYSSSDDQALYAIYDSNGNLVDTWHALGENTGNLDTNYTFDGGVYKTWTNSTAGTVTVVLGLRDYSYYAFGWAVYWSDGTSLNTGTEVNHAKVGYVKGKVVVSINDTVDGTKTTSTSIPTTLGAGDFNATVKISKH